MEQNKPCECGCGISILSRDSRGRNRRFAKGHAIAHINRNRTPEHSAKLGASKRANFEAQFADGIRTCAACQEDKPLESYLLKSKNKYSAQCRQCRTPAYKPIYNIQYQYKVSEEEAIALYEQEFCDICGGQANRVDHNHATGEVRGKLCHGCNTTLGFMKDDPNLLIAAAAYLLKSTNVLGEVKA